jgi:D-sedoheptulose 7-phosphate isomerase
MPATIESLLSDSIRVKQAMLDDSALLKDVTSIATMCTDAFRRGNKVLLAGNGGSAADAQHIAAEFLGRFELERRGLPALALATNGSSVTAIANDFGYDTIFRRQVEALAVAGDVFIGFSTSGNSANVLAAIEHCRDNDIATIGLTGEGGGKMAELCDIAICVPSKNTARVQESHITLGHILCSLIESALAGKS